jgi:N-acetylneuraminic acid mutarotase
MKFITGVLAALVCTGAIASQARPRSLTFEERVKAQEAIERVYYSHRIGHADSFEKAVPREVVEGKVRKYLEQTGALASDRKIVVTDAMLQAELQRMTAGTRMPERLHELYTALGNDPFVIKECLARATLVDRLTRDSHAVDPSPYAGTAQRPLPRSVTRLRHRRPGSPATSPMVSTPLPNPKAEAALPYGTICPTEEAWATTSLVNAPTSREFQTAVWTGTEMIVWGGHFYDGTDYVIGSGGRYDPATDTWSPTSTTGAPDARMFQTAVWTGTEMIVWGGLGVAGFLNSGGLYDPVTDSWAPTSMTGAPSGRYDQTAVWTGTEMIVWGGYFFIDPTDYQLNTGGRYNPSTNTWTATSTGTNVPSPRELHTAVWTGSRMVIWGGWNGSDLVNTGGRYDPATNSWTTTSTTDAPPGVELHTAVWTGSRMVVWGGWDGFQDVQTGGRYDPANNSWTATSLTDASSPRDSHTAVWTGSRMAVWAGVVGDFSTFVALDTGDWYDPATDVWTPLVQTGAPTARFYHTAVWTGGEMVVWGGEDGSEFFDTGGSYIPVDNDGDGLSSCEGDCNDSNAEIYPGATEVCNGEDDDCDTTVDPGGDALCDDADVCTIDACDGAAGCSYVVNTCSDTNACTAESCVPVNGCIYPSANLDSTGFSAARVDGRDLVILADAWNSELGDPNYNVAANLDQVGRVDLDDFHLFMITFGQICP